MSCFERTLRSQERRSRNLRRICKKKKEISKKELQSFARTLRGVDELRSAAESMSRQVNQFKSHTPPRRRTSAGRGFTDEVVEDFDFQLEESVKMIESEGKRFENVAAEKEETNKPNRFWGLDLMYGNKPRKDADVPIGEELDQVDEDIKKIMNSKNKRREEETQRVWEQHRQFFLLSDIRQLTVTLGQL